MSDVQQEIASCQLFGLVGILIQILLGALSFSVLVYKRYGETPKRPWKIWALDTSKQGTSQMLAHFVNVAISMQLSSQLASDACIWYFTTNILDNTIGVFLCVGVLRLIETHAFSGKYERLKSGNYYFELEEFDDLDAEYWKNSTLTSPEKPFKPLEMTRTKKKYVYLSISDLSISYRDWALQFLLWNTIVIISKTLLFYLELLLNTPLTDISLFLIGWIQPYETLELILVIIVVPVIMNGFAFWIQDNFLMKQESTNVHFSAKTLIVEEKTEPSQKDAVTPLLL